MSTLRWPDLLVALRDFRRTWPQLLAADLLARVLAVAVTAPLVGLLLKLFLIGVDDGVLADADIAVFLLHPIGIVALISVGAVSLAVLFAEVGILMVIGFGAAEDRRVTYVDAARYVARHAATLVRIAAEVIVRLLLISSPFLAGIAGVYLLFLDRYDINFYLTDKPPEFWRAAAVAGLLLAGLAIAVVWRFAGWILALPMLLFAGKHARPALHASVRATADSRWRIGSALTLFLLASAVASLVVSFLTGLFGSLLVPRFGGSLTWMAAGIAVTLLLTGLANLTVSFVTTALLPLFLVRLYSSLAGPGRLEPALAARGSLGERASWTIPGKAFLWIGAAVLLVIAGGAYATTRNLGPQDHAQIIAHRGASAAAPENTMAAFERAIEQGADWIELDVQEDADGVVVVAHDSDFMKVSRVDLKVWDATATDFRDLDIGSWFAPDFADQRVPTLLQVLQRANGDVGVVIELKYYGHDRKLESRVVDVVEQAGMASRIKIMSLKLGGLRKAAALRPEWTHGLLNTASVGKLTNLDLDFLALNGAAATPSMIRRAHAAGMLVYVWTVNDPIQMSVMLSRGVDGLITDEPAVARQVIELREQLSPFGRLVIWIAGEAGLLRRSGEASTVEDA